MALKMPMTRPFQFLSVVICLSAASARAVDFASEIQPLLAEHCLECHGPDASKGGLNLETRDLALKVLKSGERGIVPGDPAKSALVARVTTTDLEDRMPPKEKKPLKPDEVEKLSAWIAEGAKFDTHWAYKPIPAGAAMDARALSKKIDESVRAALAKRGFAASARAEPVVLIKRLYYDLLGLPPTPERVDRFLADNKTDATKAYGDLLDEVLASPHFGERWGRHWLDAARYADSDGYEKDRARPDAWRFRDWVIRAINADMPFDQFTIEQLAGDLLPNATPEQIVATAFNRQTLTNTEGGTDQEQFRIEACMDRTETLGTVWLGLTVGCARCHTHKYDKISHKEYYQMFSFFNNADEVLRQAPESPEKWAAYEKANGYGAQRLVDLQKKVDEAKAQLPVKLPAWEKPLQDALAEVRASGVKTQTFAVAEIAEVKAESKVKYVKQPDSSWLISGKPPNTDVTTVTLAPLKMKAKALQLEVLTDKSLPGNGPGLSKNGNFVLGELEVLVDGVSQLYHNAKADYSQKTFEPKGVNDGDAQTGWAVAGGTGKPHQLTIQMWEPIAEGKQVTVRLTQRYKHGLHVIGKFRFKTSSDVTEDSVVPAEVVKILNEEPKRRNPVLIQPLWEWMAKVDPEVRKAAQALEEAKARLPKPPLMDVRVIAERTNNPRQTKVLHRGDFLSPTDEVVPAAFSTLPPIKTGEKANRLDLARWLVSKDHPLTARVAVNQMWGKLFGEGIVRTAADFGVRGDKPTNPALLDLLARQFMENGWSRKQLIRAICLSETYCQSSENRPGSKESSQDALNTSLWRQNRLRVEGEIVRDLHLAASGLLSEKIGGPSVFPPMPPDIADLSYANNFKWTNSKGEDRYRRGLYTFFKRTAPHPDLTTFDCPDANITNIKRTVSNTPLQALTTLNAESFAEAARALAQRVLKEKHADDRARLTRAFRLCLCRAPTDKELSALVQLLEDSRKFYGKAKEEDAWMATTRIILNTDELITRD